MHKSIARRITEIINIVNEFILKLAEEYTIIVKHSTKFTFYLGIIAKNGKIVIILRKFLRKILKYDAS